MRFVSDELVEAIAVFQKHRSGELEKPALLLSASLVHQFSADGFGFWFSEAMPDASRKRLAMQDWRCFPSWLDQSLWDDICNGDAQQLHVLENLGKRLIRMGLRCPSEHTHSMLAAILVKRQNGSVLNGQMLHNTYLSVKAHMNNLLNRCRNDPIPGEIYVTVLPADPNSAEIPQAVRDVAFPQGAVVPAWNAWPFGEIIGVASEIPLRKTNASLATKTWQGGQSPDWQSFMQIFGGFAAGMASRRQVEEPLPLTMLQPPRPAGRQALGDLLQRAESQVQEGGDGRQQLALPAPPAPTASIQPCMEVKQTPPGPTVGMQGDMQASAPAATMQGGMEPMQIVQPIEQKTQAAQPAEGQCQGALPQQTENKAGAVENGALVAEAPDAQMSLSKSMEMLQNARSKLKEERQPCKGAMKRPAKKEPAPSVEKAQQKGSKTAAVASKGKGLKKKGKSLEERRAARDKIFKSLPKSLQRKFQYGCVKCRQAPRCTLSCWVQRGYEA